MSTETGVAYKSAPGRWILAVTITGSGMAFLDSTIVNVALPAIGRDFHASTSDLQWIVNGYLLTLASLILLGGSLGDRFGRRRVFVVGTAMFTGASLLCAIAPDVRFLIGARLLQGAGAALLTPGSLAMIEASFRREDRGRAIGAWTGLTGVVSALGPLLGGWLIEAVSWRAAFLINIPLGIFVVVAATRHVPESRDPTDQGHIDVLGAALAAAALGGTTYALVEGPGRGWPPAIVATAVAGAVALVAFVRVERHSPNPMLPLGIFASRQFRAANGITFVVYAALGGMFFLLVSFLQVSLGYSPLAAGAALLPQTVLMLLLSARAGGLVARIGARIPLTAGPLLIAAGMVMMSGLGPGDGYAQAVLPAVVVIGCGIVLVATPVTSTALGAVDESHAGVASGVNNAVARVANLLAVAVLPVVAGITGDRFYDPDAMTHGFHIAMLVCAGLAAAGGALAWLTIDRDTPEESPEASPAGSKRAPAAAPATSSAPPRGRRRPAAGA